MFYEPIPYQPNATKSPVEQIESRVFDSVLFTTLFSVNPDQSFNVRIGHLYRPEFRLHDSPEEVVAFFNDIETMHDALYVAATFRNRLGVMAICHYASRRYGRMLTLMDRIFMCREEINPLLFEAFMLMGFVHGECLYD